MTQANTYPPRRAKSLRSRLFGSTVWLVAACAPATNDPADASALPGAPDRAMRDAGLSSSPSTIRIVGRQLLIDGSAVSLRGVCWNPVGKGGTHPADLDFSGFVAQDSALMAELGLNVVRTYEPLLDTAVLDQLWGHGIRVINSVYPYGGTPVEVVVERVRAVKSHPAILMWALGNEWNYNGLYVDLGQEEATARLKQAADLIRTEDDSHPIATIYGGLPSPQVIAALPEIDIWGINSYRGLSFGDLFDTWRALSPQPMFLSEYGADAFNATTTQYDPDSQAQAVVALTRELLSQGSSDAAGVALGGTLFEWADEWWKDSTGTALEHDTGGIAPGGGPFPDGTFNEEWWGLVDIDRVARPAYTQLRDLLSSQSAGSPL